ncbi:MAG: twin-arginine translocase subunit TatB [Nitrospirae bacterium]|nr:twin-arginine translocase subunit TatB [Nitrospirota bacterium]
MFDIGIQEIVLIFVIALLVYGPKDLPELGRKVGRYLAMFKRMVNDVKRQMDSELYEYTDPIKKEMEKINRETLEAASKFRPDITPEKPADEKPAGGIPPAETQGAVPETKPAEHPGDEKAHGK